MRVLVVKGPMRIDPLAMYRVANGFPDLAVQVVGVRVEGRPNGDLAKETVPFKVWRAQLGWIYPELSSIVGTFKPDLVHVGLEPWALLVAQALRTHLPVVGHGAENQSYTHGSRLEALIRPRLASRNLARLSGYASWNSDGIALARHHGLRPFTPTLIAPGELPDPQPFIEAAKMRSRARAKLGMKNERRYVGYVGRLVEMKGVQVLIDALARLGRSDVELVLAGSGPMASGLAGHARAARVTARFFGTLSPGEIPAFNAACDVIVVPSLTTNSWAEQFGRVAAEAMFAATPLVVSDSGALPEVVGDHVSIVSEGDPDALGRAVGLLLDEEEASKRARLAQRYALQEYSPESVAAKLKEFWRSAIRYSQE